MTTEESREWDEHYTGDGDDVPVWSGRVNGTLVAEVAGMEPGTVLDVGCGEGADAIWLAHRGWRVRAVDPSRVALDRAVAAADRAGVEVEWVHAGLLGMPGGTGQHDLVSAQYPALRKTDDHAAIDALLGAVAPGGTLLVVHHDINAEMHDHAHDGFDPADYERPHDVASHLGDAWEIEIHETRPRPCPPETGRGAAHADDIVLRARRPA